MYKKIASMVQKDYIVAIDLGTSHIVGMIGMKTIKGTIAIIAEEVEDSASCIRRGCVYNVEETASRIKRLVLKLQNKLPGSRIEKAYIGVGGQSLRSIEHIEVKTMNNEHVVTDDDIRTLFEQCKSYHPDMLDVLAIAEPAYFIDNKQVSNPVGISAKRIEARYKLIVGRPSIRRHVLSSIAERAHIDVADIIVSPLALADVILTQNEKNLGCALVDFGAGVTSVTIFKGGHLVGLSIIPLGGNLITRDLTSLKLIESEAERLKITYGSAILDKANEGVIPLGAIEGVGVREISQNEFNIVVEARVKEIVENVYAQLEVNGVANSLGAGIVLCGGAAALKNMQELIQTRVKQDVRFSSVRSEFFDDNEETLGNSNFMTSLSILAKGEVNCIDMPIVKPKVEPEPFVSQVEPEPVKEPEKPKKKRSKLGGGLFGKMVKDLFEED